MKTIRASSCGRADVCPRSTIPPEVWIEMADPTAAMGTAAHAAMAEIVEGGNPDLTKIAEQHNVDSVELSRLVDYGRQAWDELKTLFPGAKSEHYMEHESKGVMLTGHADVICNMSRILDWKAGWKSDSERHLGQLKAYCWLRLQEIPTSFETTAIVVFLRDHTWVKYTWACEELDRWMYDLVAKIAKPEAHPYSPGAHCQYCPREHECPAIQAQTRAGLALAKASEGGGPLVLADALLAYKAVQYAERVCKSTRASLRNHVATHGPIEADGQCLRLKSVNKREISARLGWDVMASRLTIDELAKVVKVGIGDLVKAVKAKVGLSPRGAKRAAELELLEDLEAAGALSYREHSQLELTAADEHEGDDVMNIAEAS